MRQIITLLAVLSFGLVFGQACDGLTSINYNGHTYELVEIGNQCWFKENLQTTKYKEGAYIKPAIDSAIWVNDTTGAYAWYNNDSISYGSTYGALYNGYAVDNPAGLCPTGWHVPSDSAWTILENYLESNGYNFDGSTTGNKYAKAMADSILWVSDTGTGTVGNIDYQAYRNKSGFSGLPAGYRHHDGSFNGIGYNAYMWTSFYWDRMLVKNHSLLIRGNGSMASGFSVRCLKDTGSIQTSMNEYDIFNINIYPNPFTTSTTIELPSETHKLTIYDIVGNKVREEQVIGTTTIERGDLTKGVYVLEVRSDNQPYSGKLVVE